MQPLPPDERLSKRLRLRNAPSTVLSNEFPQSLAIGLRHSVAAYVNPWIRYRAGVSSKRTLPDVQLHINERCNNAGPGYRVATLSMFSALTLFNVEEEKLKRGPRPIFMSREGEKSRSVASEQGGLVALWQLPRNKGYRRAAFIRPLRSPERARRFALGPLVLN
jgi:hypothetical protein